MNEIVNKIVLVGDKFMPEVHLKQPSFTYSACGPFTRNKEGAEKLMQTGNTDFISRNELDKACFQHDMAYGKSKGLAKRTQSDKFFGDKAFKIAMIEKNFLIESLVGVALLLNQIIGLQMNLIGKLLENLRDEKFIHLLETIFGVLI